MEIRFNSKKLDKILSDSKKIKKRYGEKMARKIMQRLDDMRAASNLEELMRLPGRHHPLTGNREGQFACDLINPYRLIYEPVNDPLPLNKDGGLIYREITIIDIVEIKDYH